MTDADRPEVELGVRRVLDPRVIGLQRTVGWITVVAIGAPSFLAVVVLALRGSTPAWLAITAAVGWMSLTAWLAWLAERWPAIAYRHAWYIVDEHGIEIRRGVVWRHVTNVPRSRVQHTDVSQGPLERSHGLGTLVIHTAGTEHAMVNVEGLAHSTALALRDHLLPRGAGDAV